MYIHLLNFSKLFNKFCPNCCLCPKQQNDREQLYLNQQHSASDQGRALQEKQVKIKKLERTCREQEKALEKMEKLLMSKRPRNDKQEGTRLQIHTFQTFFFSNSFVVAKFHKAFKHKSSLNTEQYRLVESNYQPNLH